MVEYLSQHLGVPTEEIATIGDQPNDVLMFKRSGFSIAMGNASDEVKAQASRHHRIPTTTKVSPRRWSDSSSARRGMTHERDRSDALKYCRIRPRWRVTSPNG